MAPKVKNYNSGQSNTIYSFSSPYFFCPLLNQGFKTFKHAIKAKIVFRIASQLYFFFVIFYNNGNFNAIATVMATTV